MKNSWLFTTSGSNTNRPCAKPFERLQRASNLPTPGVRFKLHVSSAPILLQRLPIYESYEASLAKDRCFPRSRCVFSSGSQVQEWFSNLWKNHDCSLHMGSKQMSMCQTLWTDRIHRIFHEKLWYLNQLQAQDALYGEMLYRSINNSKIFSTCTKLPNFMGRIQTAYVLCTRITLETTELRVIWSCVREGPMFFQRYRCVFSNRA